MQNWLNTARKDIFQVTVESSLKHNLTVLQTEEITGTTLGIYRQKDRKQSRKYNKAIIFIYGAPVFGMPNAVLVPLSENNPHCFSSPVQAWLHNVDISVKMQNKVQQTTTKPYEQYNHM